MSRLVTYDVRGVDACGVKSMPDRSREGTKRSCTPDSAENAEVGGAPQGNRTRSSKSWTGRASASQRCRSYARKRSNWIARSRLKVGQWTGSKNSSTDDRNHGAIQCEVSVSSVKTSEDHVPSKGLLREPRRVNLPMVNICTSCNNGFSADEEDLFLLLTAFWRVQRTRIVKLTRRSAGRCGVTTSCAPESSVPGRSAKHRMAKPVSSGYPRRSASTGWSSRTHGGMRSTNTANRC